MSWTQVALVVGLLAAGVVLLLVGKVPSLGELLIGAAVGAARGAFPAGAK